MKAFPKTIYVKREKSSNGDEYFNPAQDIAHLADIGVRERVGVYVLKETVEIKGVVVTNTVRR